MRGGYNFIIKNNSNQNKQFMQSDFPLIFFDESKDTFENTYDKMCMHQKSSLPFYFEKIKLIKYYILFYKDDKVYLQILDETNKIFVVEPIISQAEYFFGKTGLLRIRKDLVNNPNPINIYQKWEEELLESLETGKITPEEIHSFLFMKNINTNEIIKNNVSLNAHKKKLLQKNSDYFNYTKPQKRIPRDMLHYYMDFFTKNPQYDIRPEQYKKK